MPTTFRPTHRITATRSDSTTTFTVMLVDRAAYTEVEWETRSQPRAWSPRGDFFPAWERTDAGEWRYGGDVAAFSSVEVTPIAETEFAALGGTTLADAIELLADALAAARERAGAGDTVSVVTALREVEAGARMVADAAEQVIGGEG